MDDILPELLKIGIPILAVAVAMMGYLETRLKKKQDTSACDERLKLIEANTDVSKRLEIRMMRLENHLIGKALSVTEANKEVKKNKI